MIKIIKRGTIQKRTCEECGCVFSFEEEDVEFLRTVDNGLVPPEIRKLIRCPQCKTEMVLEATR